MATKPSPPRTALIVLGMHRSGTSALAGTLARMGADLPQDLIAPSEMNPKGFFESESVTALNDELLESAGLRWFSYNPVSSDWFASPKAGEFKERAVTSIFETYGQSRLFILKDPRICRLLPFWHEVLKEANCVPLHVCTHRHPVDVAGSLNLWANYEPGYGLQLWLRHVLEAEAASRGHARTFTSYERLMKDWDDVVTRAGRMLDLNWPRDPQTASPDVEAFLSRDLQHFSQSAEKAAINLSSLPGWVTEAFEVFERWAAHGESEEDYQFLDHIRITIQEAGATIGPAIWRNQEQYLVIDNLTNKITALEASAKSIQAKATEYAADIAAEQQARDSAQELVRELEEALEGTRNQLQALEASSSEVCKAHNGTLARVSELEQVLEETRSAYEAEIRRCELAANERYQGLEKGHAVLHNEYETLEQTLEQERRERDQISSQLAQSRAETADLHNQSRADALLISDLQVRLEWSEREYAALTKQANRNKRHLDAMTKLLAAQVSKAVHMKLGDGMNKDRAPVQPPSSRDLLAAEARSTELVQTFSGGRRELHTHRATNAKEFDPGSAEQLRVSELEQALASARGELRSLQAINTKTASENEAQKAIQADYQALLNSTSWRITAPLRRVVDKLRGN